MNRNPGWNGTVTPCKNIFRSPTHNILLTLTPSNQKRAKLVNILALRMRKSISSAPFGQLPKEDLRTWYSVHCTSEFSEFYSCENFEQNLNKMAMMLELGRAARVAVSGIEMHLV